MRVSKNQYSEMTGNSSPASPIWKDLFMAFIFGGFICTVGQFLNQFYMSNFDLDKKTAGTWTSITLIAISSLLTALNWYGNIAKHAGAGTIVPITGFSNSITAPAIEFKSENGKLFIKTPVDANYMVMATQDSGSVKQNVYEELSLRSLYTINETRIVVPEGLIVLHILFSTMASRL